MSTIEDFVADMKKLGTFDEDLARLAAPAIEAAAKKNVAAGMDPEGKPWKAKKDGSQPLKNAAAHVSATANGTVVELVVEGVEAYHQRFKEDGAHPRRQLIPDEGDPIPPYIADALDSVIAQVRPQ